MAEGGGLLNRYRVVKPYRGFESLRLRHRSLAIPNLALELFAEHMAVRLGICPLFRTSVTGR